MEDKVNMYSCVKFVPRGTMARKIQKVKHKREELEKIITEMKLKEAEYQGRPNAERKTSQQEPSEGDDDEDDIENKYGLDAYDDEDEDDPMGIETLILDNPPESNSEDSDVEEDEFSVKPSDNVLLGTHIADDVSMLEVYVFNHEKAEFFLLHDIYLPSFPLALQWLNFDKEKPNEAGSFAAIGYISNEIDVWDLTVTGSLEPTLSLSTKKSGKGKRHTKAVMDLSWNKCNRHILGSSSADQTVRLWDLSNGSSVLKLDMFEEKVQSIDFHRDEAHNILTGDCAGHVKLFDCRDPGSFKTLKLENEIEKVVWSEFSPFHYFASTNTGMLHYVDARTQAPVWNLKGHDKEITGISVSSECADMMVTVSMDETVKVWDLKDNKPEQVTQKNVDIGEIYTIDSCPDVPYVFCFGGKHKHNPLYLWDSRENEAVVQRFCERMGADFLKFSTVKIEQPGPSSRPQSSSSQRINLKKKPRKVPRPTSSDPGTSSGASSSRQLPNSQRSRDRKKMHPKTKDKK